MKKRVLTILGIAACAAMLFGCHKGEILAVPAEPAILETTTEAAPATITIEGGAAPLVLSEETRALMLTCPQQVESLISQAENVTWLEEIRLSGFVPQAQEILWLEETFENTSVACDEVKILGEVYPAGLTELDLTNLQWDQVETLGQELPVLKNLEFVYLSPLGEVGTVSLEAAAALQSLCPDLNFYYAQELFGQLLTTDMEQVNYFKVPIGDEGLEQLRMMLPLMYNLDCLTLDWCETSNEAMAALRDEFAEDFSVVWRVFFGEYNCLTDTYRLWANGMTTAGSEVLKYCTEVRYMDLGHSPMLENVDFLAYMPHIQVVILGDCTKVTSLEPLRNCPDIEYLEIFSTQVTDLSPLAELTKLEHLNISRVPAEDLSPIMELSNMKRLWSNSNPHLESQAEEFQERYPDCQVVTKGGNSVSYQWRFTTTSRQVYAPRYALLRAQIGYGVGEMAKYPKGYLREEITYESTGIDPIAGQRVAG